MNNAFGPPVTPREISESELPDKTLVLNIGHSLEDYIKRCNLPADFRFTSAHIMSFVQRAWSLSPERANRAELILPVNSTPDGRMILGAFVFGRGDRTTPDNFKRSPYIGDGDRFIFLAEPALPEVWNKFVGHYLPAIKQGEANPVRYYHCDQSTAE